MAALITVGGYVLPTPSTYVGNTATIVDAARNVEGRTIGTVLRNDVAKVTATWNWLTAAQWAAILQRFDPNYGGSFYQSVTFFNQSSNSLVTRTMYVNDRTTSGVFKLYNERTAPNPAYIGLPHGYQGATLALIEC